MKILLSNNTNSQDGSYEFINNITHLDPICCNAESTSIIVDNFLSLHEYRGVQPLLAKICSKLRMNGEICVIDKELGLLSHMFARNSISVEQFNEIFDGGPLMSLFDGDCISQILESLGITITEKYLVGNNFVIKGVRC
jgi:hypothetical protein